MFDEIKKIIDEIKKEENKTKQMFQEVENYNFKVDELEKLRKRIIRLSEVFKYIEERFKYIEERASEKYMTKGLENYCKDYLRRLKDINSYLESIVREFRVWGRATKNLEELFDTVTEYTYVRRQ